jgi:formylglycine-generating enzyme required for sulfatase activity
MVVAPAGSFMMGSPWDLDGDERPQHKVTFAKPFAIGEGPITAGEWNACAADGGCGGYRMPKELSDDAAAILISWHDAHAYVEWLSKKTGKHYRLPSEAEWEYAARAGTTTYIWWGGDTLPKPELDRVTVEKALLPNPWGLRLVVGTLRQWVEDCKSDYDILTLQNYAGAPTDGSAWLRNCSDRRVVRGFRSSSYRETVNADQRVNLLVPTFRVVRDLP